MNKLKLTLTIFGVGFLLNLVWENLHAPLYQEYTNFWDHFMINALASLGDGALIVLFYFIFSTWKKNTYWIKCFNWIDAFLFMIFGALVAIGIEQLALSYDIWHYTEKMPVILSTGLTPLIQLILLPSLTLLLTKAYVLNMK